MAQLRQSITTTSSSPFRVHYMVTLICVNLSRLHLSMLSLVLCSLLLGTPAMLWRPADILHWVRVCNQCGVDWCNGNWHENTPTVEDHYQVGSTLDAWGCGMVTGRTARTRNSVTGNIYAIERGKLSIETPTHGQGGLALSCSSSSGSWDQVNPYSDWKVFSSPIEEPPIDWHSNSFEDNAW